MKTVAAHSMAQYAAKPKEAARSSSPPKRRAGGSEAVFNALSALAWFRSNPRGKIGDDKAAPLASLLDKATGRIVVGKQAWKDLVDSAKDGETKRSELNKLVRNWLADDEAQTLVKAHGELAAKDDEKASVLVAVSNMYGNDAATRKVAADMIKEKHGKLSAGVGRLWNEGKFELTDKPSAPKTRTKAKDSKDMEAREAAKVQALIAKEEDLRNRLLTPTGRIRRDAKSATERKQLDNVGKALGRLARAYAEAKVRKNGGPLPAKELNKETNRLFKRTIVNDTIDFGLMGLCEDPKTEKESMCWFQTEDEPTNGTFAIVAPSRRIEITSKKNSKTVFSSFIMKDGKKQGQGTYVSRLSRIAASTKAKHERVDDLIAMGDDLLDKWRRDLKSNDSFDKTMAAAMELMYHTSFRIGKPTGERANTGIGTLRVLHIVGINSKNDNFDMLDADKFKKLQERIANGVRPKSYKLRYEQKTSHPFKMHLNPAESRDGTEKAMIRIIVNMVTDSIMSAKSPNDFLFRTKRGLTPSSKRIGDYADKIGVNLGAHDLRRLKGNILLKEETEKQKDLLASVDNVVDAKNRFVKTVATVAERMNHLRNITTKKGSSKERMVTGTEADWDVTLRSYMTPNTVREFFDKTQIGRVPKDIAVMVGTGRHFDKEEIASFFAMPNQPRTAKTFRLMDARKAA